MADQSGFFRLGDALAGDSELEYQKGLQLGANTENALAEARERKQKSQAQIDLADQLEATGAPRTLAVASAGALTAGGGLGDVVALLGKNQEKDFRATAGDPTKTFAERNTALQGVAAAPVERFGTVGENMYQDKFSDAPAPTTSEYGTANIKAKEASANASNARAAGAKRKIIMVGGVPYALGDDGSLEEKLTPEQVADNFSMTEQGKGRGRNTAKAEAVLPKAFQQYRSASEEANTVIGKVDDALKDIDWVSAGPSAWAARNTPGTSAFKLDQAVASIKANAGFMQLSKMRHESPTGGALGNVTEQELKFLQNAIASLDTAQNPADLAKALTAVRDHYSKYKEYAQQDFELAQKAAQYKSFQHPDGEEGGGPQHANGGAVPGQPITPTQPATGAPMSLDDYLKSKGH